VVEASFDGAESAPRAARAACDVLAGVRRVQRAAENEFQVVGAMTSGTAGAGPDGITVTTGGGDQLLHRLREAAAPGQILMSSPPGRPARAWSTRYRCEPARTAPSRRTSCAASGRPS